MNNSMKVTATVIAVLLLTATTAQAADPAMKCESGKLKESSKYVACRLKADAKAVSKGEPVDYTKCEVKFAAKWPSIEGKAQLTAEFNACPTEGDQASMETRITSDAAEIATLLAGGTVASCGDDVAEGDESCDGADLASETCEGLGFASGTLACTAGCGFDVSGCVSNPAPVDCGNGVIDGGEDCDLGAPGTSDCDTETSGVSILGDLSCDSACQYDTSGCQARYEEQNVGGEPTVVDHLTGLEWVVTNDSGVGLLDKDNTYTWSTGTNDADGTAFTVYIAGLNSGSYGGHDDWRLPSSGGCCGVGPFAPAELDSILDCGFGSPCIDQALFGDTASSGYWAATTYPPFTEQAWLVNFDDGSVFSVTKIGVLHVRAVRGGL